MARKGLGARVREHGPALAAMLGVLLVVHARELFFGQELAREDIGQAFYPWLRYIAAQRVVGNWLPWCPDIGCGHPLWANIQAGAFYPPNLLMMLPLSPARVFATLYLLHYLWGAWGVYFVARRFGLTRLPGTVAGVIYAATGFMAAHENHYALMCTASWMPWVALGALNFAANGSRGGFGLAAVGYGCHFLCHPQPFMHTGAFALGCVLVAGFSERWRRGLTLRRLGLALLPLVVGVLLAGVQLVPTAALLRSGLGEERKGLGFMVSFGLSPRALVGLVLPHFYGTASGPYWGPWNFWEVCGYIGGLALLCIMLVGGRERATRRLYVGLAVLGGAALFMGWGKHNPAYLLLQHVPPFNHFRAPGRWLVVWSASGALLTGLCLQELRERLTVRRPMGLVAAGFCAAAAAGLGLFAVSWHRTFGAGDMPAGVGMFTPRDWDLLIFGLGAALAAWMLIRPGPVRSVRWMALAMVLQSMAFSLYDPPIARAGWSDLPPALVGKVPQRMVEGRLALVMLRPADAASGAGVHATAADGAVDQPPPEVIGLRANANLLNGVPVFNVYDPLTAPAEVLRKALGTRVLSRKVATSLGIRCILTNFAPDELPGHWQARAKVVGAKSGRDMYLYDNPGYAGLAWTATRFTGSEEAHAIIRDESRPADFMLDAPLVQPEPEGIAATEMRRPAQVTQWDARGISVEVADGPPCALIITSVNLLGWSATVNGTPAELRVANGAFCAVMVPGGPAQVRLSYSPYGLGDGARVSLAGLVLLLLALVVPRRRL